MSKGEKFKPHPIDVEDLDVVEILVALGGIEHNVKIYFGGLAKRQGTTADFYEGIVASILKDTQLIKDQIKGALR